MSDKRRHGDGSVRTVKRGERTYFEARATIHGKQRSFYGPSEAAALAKARAARADAERGSGTDAGTLTLADHMDDWLSRVVRPSVQSSTYASYESLTRVHILPRLGRVRLVDLNPSHVRGLLVHMIDNGSAEGTAGRARSCLSAALKVAMHDYGLPRNVAALVQVPKTGRPQFQPEVITPTQAQAILAAFDASRLGPLVRFAVATGLRQGELLALRWEDIGADSLQVHHSLQRARSKGAERFTSRPKTKKSQRPVPLSALARDALAARKRQAAEDQLAAGPDWHDEGFIFANATGGARDGTAVTRAFQRILRSHGLEPIRWHALRRVFAAVLLDGGADITVVRDLLGHSQLSVTEKYAYVMPAALPGAVSAIDRAFGPSTQDTDKGTARADDPTGLADSA